MPRVERSNLEIVLTDGAYSADVYYQQVDIIRERDTSQNRVTISMSRDQLVALIYTLQPLVARRPSRASDAPMLGGDRWQGASDA